MSTWVDHLGWSDDAVLSTALPSRWCTISDGKVLRRSSLHSWSFMYTMRFWIPLMFTIAKALSRLQYLIPSLNLPTSGLSSGSLFSNSDYQSEAGQIRSLDTGNCSMIQLEMCFALPISHFIFQRLWGMTGCGFDDEWSMWLPSLFSVFWQLLDFNHCTESGKSWIKCMLILNYDTSIYHYLTN